jgi:hypothetical protein
MSEINLGCPGVQLDCPACVQRTRVSEMESSSVIREVIESYESRCPKWCPKFPKGLSRLCPNWTRRVLSLATRDGSDVQSERVDHDEMERQDEKRGY